MNTDQPHPCPFCGSQRIVKGERFYAMCVDCGATGPERNADATVRKFTGDWNTRHTDAQLLADKERIEKRLNWVLWRSNFTSPSWGYHNGYHTIIISESPTVANNFNPKNTDPDVNVAIDNAIANENK